MKIGRVGRGSAAWTGACGLLLALSAAGAGLSGCGSSSGNGGGKSGDAGAHDSGEGDVNVPPKDGGTDGAVADGGSGADAEPGDAGHDGGETTGDAGDAGSTGDSGTIDSGTIDSGTIDSGTGDSGSTSDGGTIDSGAGDSGSTSDGGPDGSASKTTLLIDNDFSDNNDPNNTSPTPSASDTLFPTLLAGATTPVAFNTQVVASDNGSEGSTPVAADLSPYTRIVWYCGSAGSCISNYQTQLIEGWLDLGGKEAIIFDEKIISDAAEDWLGQNGSSDALLFGTSPLYLGLTGGEFDPFTDDTTTTSYDDGYSGAPVAAGVASTPFAGLTFKMTVSDGDTSTFIDWNISDFNVGTSGPVSLVTIAAAEPDSNGDGNYMDGNYPLVAATKTAGQAGTSKIVLVGMPIEDINSLGASAQQFMNAALSY